MSVPLKPPLDTKPSQSIGMRLAQSKWWSCTTWAVFEDDLRITSIEPVAWFGSRAKFELDLCLYDILHEWRTAAYILHREGEEVCRARKHLARRKFTVRYQSETFCFQPRSAFDRTFVLSHGDLDAGWVAPRGLFQNYFDAKLPSRLPPEVRIFFMWLALSTVSSS